MLQWEIDCALAINDESLHNRRCGFWADAHLSGVAGGLLTACLKCYSQGVGTATRAMEASHHVTP